MAAASSRTKKRLTELIGEHPSKKREKERKKVEIDRDALRQIALDKGLNPNF